MATYLKNRNGIFYYDRRIPSDVIELCKKYNLGAVCFKTSLKTSKKDEALLKAANLSLWLGKFFELIRSNCYSFDEIEKILEEAPFRIKEVFALQSKKNNADKQTISKLYEVYEAERLRANRWRDKTRKDQQQMIRLLIELLGKDCHPESITRAELLEVREKICKLPPNLTKVPAFKDKSLAEILAMPDVKPMSSTRAYRIISHLRAFFRWIYLHGILESDISSGLVMAKRRSKRSDEERVVYSNDDLKSLFRTKLFKGEDKLDRPENFFIILIGMYSGMRCKW